MTLKRPRLAHQYARAFMPSTQAPSAQTATASAECLNLGQHSPGPAAGTSVGEQDETPPDELVRQAMHLRHQRGLTQGEFAEELGIPRATLKDWEQGRRCPRGPSRALLEQSLLHS